MVEEIWKARLEQNCHLVVKAEELIFFKSWLPTTGFSLLSTHNLQDTLIKELVSIELPNLNSLHSVFQERVIYWQDLVKAGYGNWIYYPWHQALAWLPEKDDFFTIRTSRNKHLITQEEQNQLLNTSIGIIGLSVGHSIASALAMECCGGELRLADFDTLDLSNLNRIRASVLQLGLPKTQIALRTLSEINPYLEIKVWQEGLNESNVDEFLQGLDLVIEECDSLDIKVLTRERARAFRIPVIMETADRGMMDIERFDLEPNRPIFHGMAGNLTVNQLKGLSTEEKVPFVLPLVGGEQLSTRMKASMLEINRTIKSWPQLGAQVQMGSGLCADLARKILLNQITSSGRYYFDVEGTVSSNKPTWLIAHESIESPAYTISQVSCIEHASQTKSYADFPLPEEEKLKEWIEMACLAPTGGNMQHWWWIKSGESLHLYDDSTRSASFLNFNNSGSNFGFGAALENIQLAARHDGYQLQIDLYPDASFPACIARINVKSKNVELELSQAEALYKAITIRCTDRRPKGTLPQDVNIIFEQLSELIDDSDFSLRYLVDSDSIVATSQEVGLADRIRLLNPQAHADFLAEMRWTEQENQEKRDGIDLATCYLKPSDLAVLSIAKDRTAFDFLEQQQLGLGLGELTAKLVRESPGLGLITSKGNDDLSYLRGGALTQRVWLRINQLGISFQPVSPITFLYLRNRIAGSDFKMWQQKLLSASENRFRHIWKLETEEKPMFLFRFFCLPGSPLKSMRRPVDDVFVNLRQK